MPGGNSIFANMHSPYPLSVVLAKTPMTVLGTVTLPVQYSWQNDSEDESNPKDPPVLVEFLVVDFLPVPVHLSVRHPSIARPREHTIAESVPFESESLPELYRHHRYWKSEIIFFGYEDPDILNMPVILSGKQLYEAGGQEAINAQLDR